MAFYLIDKHLTKICVDIERLKILNNIFIDRRNQLGVLLDNTEETIWITYTIRFDQKGYKVFSFEELNAYFDQATDIERIIISLETRTSLNNNRLTGEYLELCLDSKEDTRCFLVSSANNKDWCESSFSTISNVLIRFKAPYGLIRSNLTPLIIQILGVIVMYTFSIVFAYKIYSKLNIENPFFISFFFIFLILSNLWAYLNNYILAFFNKTFPNVQINRRKKDYIHWIWQTIIGTGTITVIIFFLQKTMTYLLTLFANLTIN